MSFPRLLWRNQFQNTRRSFDAVYSATSGGTVFADETYDASTPTTVDLTAGGTLDDALYVGAISKFASVVILCATGATSGGRIWEYWNGSAWTPFVVVPLKGISLLSNWFNAFAFVPPTDWATVSVSGSLPLYYTRLRVSSSSQAVSVSQIYIESIIASSEDMEAPASLVGITSPADSWESAHNIIEIEIGHNDCFDYDLGGAEATIVIPPGRYRPWEYSAKFQSLLGANYTVIYNRKTRKFSTSRVSGPFNIRFSNGTNRSRSVGVTMGYDCSQNKTGSLSYTSDFEASTTGGTIVFDVTNNIIQVDSTTVSFTQGQYSCKAACTMMKNRLDTVMSGSDDFDVQWFELTKTFGLKRRGSVAAFRWNNAITTVEAVLGYSASADDSPTANNYTVADVPIIHTYEWIALIAFPAKTIDIAFLVGSNLTVLASVTLQKTTTGNWTDISSMSPSEKMVISEIDPSFSETFIRFKIVDSANDDGYVRIGYAGIGAIADGYFEFTAFNADGVIHYLNAIEDQSRTSGGQVNTTTHAVYRGMRVPFQFIEPEDREEVEQCFRDQGTGGAVLYIPNLDDPDIAQKAIWGRLTTAIEMSDDSAIPDARYGTVLVLEEFL